VNNVNGFATTLVLDFNQALAPFCYLLNHTYSYIY